MSSTGPGASPQSASLTILRLNENVLHFSMHHHRWVQEAERRVTKNRREQIRQLLYDFEELDKGELGDSDKLQSIGEWLFLNLLPEVFQREIRQLTQPLTIRTNDPSIPWELLHDTTEFLALKLPVARHLILKSAMGPISSILDEMISVGGPFRALLVADTTEDLPVARKEGEALRLLFEAQGPCDVLFGRDATHEDLVHLLRRNVYTIIHFAGHVDYDKEDRTSFIRFRDGRMIAADEVGRIVRGSPIVFLNACMADFRSADGSERQGETSMQATESFAEAFMVPTEEGMALSVVGTVWRVPDVEAVIDFSRGFYEQLFDGTSLGEALRQCRVRAREDMQGPMVWAPYVLYGDPCLVPFADEEPEGGVIKKPSVKPDREALKVLLALFKSLSNCEVKFVSSMHILLAICRVSPAVLEAAAELCNTSIERILEGAEKGVEYLVSEVLRQTRDSPEARSKFGLSDSVSELFKGARRRAVSEGRQSFSDTDLLYCLVRKDESSAMQLLKQCGLRSEIIQALIRGDRVKVGTEAGLTESKTEIDSLMDELSESAKSGFLAATQTSQKSGCGFISTGHLLSGLIRSGSVATTVILAKGGLLDDSLLARRIEERLASVSLQNSTHQTAENKKGGNVSRRISKVLKRARHQARSRGMAKIDDALLVSEILDETDGITLEEILELGGDLEKLRQSANEFLSQQPSN